MGAASAPAKPPPGDTTKEVRFLSTRPTRAAWHTLGFLLGLATAVLAGASYARPPDPTPTYAELGTLHQLAAVYGAQATGVRVVYQDEAILPENRDVVRLLRESGAFQRVADWTNRTVALPHPIEIRVTDDLPAGIDDPSTEFDGRTIYYPAAWLNMTREFLVGVVPDITREGGPPSAIPAEKFNADDLTVWANEFVMGHEMGHALIHHLMLPLTGLEEDAADGFAVFSTLNGTQGPGPALAAAILFDEIARRLGELTFEDFSSDHPIVQQRIYNFLCYVVGSDPQGLQHSLVVEGYLPELRAMLCPLAWAQLNQGWWTVLQPHFAPGFRAEATQALERARQGIVSEERALQQSLRER
jgi:hypothetical protein